MLAGRGLRDQATGGIAIFNRSGNQGHKLELLDLGRKSVEAKSDIGIERPLNDCFLWDFFFFL